MYQGSYSLVVPYLYRAMLLHFFDEIKCRAEHDGITDIFLERGWTLESPREDSNKEAQPSQVEGVVGEESR